MFLNYDDFLNNYQAVDNLSEILQEDTGDTIILDSGVENFPDKGWVSLGGEHIFYSAKNDSNNIFSGLERPSGYETHSSGIPVFQPFSAEVINYFIEALNDKNELIDDLYISGIENSQGFRDIFDYLDNYQAINNWSSPISTYLSLSGNEIYINSGINLLPDRGWLVLAGEELFYNKKDGQKIYDLYRNSGVEHLKNTYIDQIILSQDWNILQKATKNITMDNYKFGTETSSAFFYYNCPAPDSTLLELIIYFETTSDTGNYPNSGKIPILSTDNYDMYLYAVDSSNFGLELTYNGTSVISSALEASTSGTHKIHFRHTGSGITIYLDNLSPETSNNYGTITELYLGKCDISSTESYAANIKFFSIQGSINNGFPTKNVNKITKIENLSYLDNFLVQNNSSYQANFFLY